MTSPPYEGCMEESRRLCIDLGSGLGGASRAFAESGRWYVVTVDLDRKYKPTIQADYSHLPFRPGLDPEVIVTGPDCRCFSVAGLRFHWDKDEPLPHTRKAIKTTKRLKKEIKALNPRFAVLENPTGKMRDKRVLGKPDHHIRASDYGSRFKKPTDLWEFGREKIPFPMLAAVRPWIKSPSGANVFRNETGKRPMGKGGMGDYVRPPALRALWPPALSRTIMEAVESKPRKTTSEQSAGAATA